MLMEIKLSENHEIVRIHPAATLPGSAPEALVHLGPEVSLLDEEFEGDGEFEWDEELAEFAEESRPWETAQNTGFHTSLRG